MMKKYKSCLFLFCLMIIGTSIHAQNISVNNTKQLQLKQDTLKTFALQLVQGRDASDRFRADSNFVRGLMRALQIPYSFDFKFDALETISILYPPDSSFRIFTWQLMKDEDYYRHRGVIQMNTKDGKLLRHPLFDVSDFTEKPEDSVRSAQNWVGALYYKVIQTSHAGSNYYTLLGFDDNKISSTKKWIDVLSFNKKGEPVFGTDTFFTFKEDSIPKPDQRRFFLEYKKDGRARINFDEDMNMIIYDHLISESNEPNKKFTLIPDGDYEGFKWLKGKWVHVDKVFTFQLQDGQAPIEKPVY